MALARRQLAFRLPLRASALAAAAVAGVLSLSLPAPAQDAANDPVATPTRQHWSFAGVFGKFDQAQLQRGFKVYKEVCSACHRLSIPFRALQDPDGPGFSEAQVKALAASYTVNDEELDDKGVPVKRPGRPSDLFPSPDGYPSDAAFIATFGKVPPDMWLLAKARKYERPFPLFIIDALPFFEYQEVGADYIYAILHGYTKPSDPQYDAYLSEPPYRDAAAHHRRRGEIYGRDARQARQLCRGCRRVLELGRRADDGRAQEDRFPRHDLPRRVFVCHVAGEEARLGRRSLARRGWLACRRPFQAPQGEDGGGALFLQSRS